jgi:RND family efflux transporter MFP subunit
MIITVTERGELESAKSTNVLCEVEGGGKLATIIPEGTRVKKGDEIARFDMDVLQKGINEQEVKWETADGKMKAAKSALDIQKYKSDTEVQKAETDLKLAEIDNKSYGDVEQGQYRVELDKREAALKLAEKELKEAEDNLDFTRGMVKRGFTPQEQLRAIELGVESKRFTVGQQKADLRYFVRYTKEKQETEFKAKADNARRELDRAKKSQIAETEKSANELKGAEKTAELEKRELARLRKQIEKCLVTAPQDGIVIYAKRYYWDDESSVRPGATLHFQQPIVTLPDLDQMQVKLRVHESVVKRVQKGQTATLQMEALPGTVLHGRVVSVATQAQSQGWRSAVKEYETVVSIDSLPPNAGLRPGMSAEVKILLKTVPNALTVPVQAVTEFDGKHIAYVKTAGGLERREVKVGETNETLVQIVEGINEGEHVALDARARAAIELKKSDGKDAGKKNEKPDQKDAPPTPALPVAGT